MGMRPGLCKVRKFTKKELEDEETKKGNSIYSFNLLGYSKASELNFYPAAEEERFLMMEKFHKWIVYEDVVFQDSTKFRKIIQKEYPNSDFGITGYFSKDAVNEEILGKRSKDPDLKDEVFSVILPKDNDNPINYMQLEYYRALHPKQWLKFVSNNKEVMYWENRKLFSEYTVKCPIIHYEEVRPLSFRFDDFKDNLPNWFFTYGYIVTNSKLKAYIDYMKKDSLGRKQLIKILDRGGLKDNELIDMFY